MQTTNTTIIISLLQSASKKKKRRSSTRAQSLTLPTRKQPHLKQTRKGSKTETTRDLRLVQMLLYQWARKTTTFKALFRKKRQIKGISDLTFNAKPRIKSDSDTEALSYFTFLYDTRDSSWHRVLLVFQISPVQFSENGSTT